jgi:hypothetical protein
MTITLMIFATAAAYAAGIATMLVVNARRAKLAERIPIHWVPQTGNLQPPPPLPRAPTLVSPFAPKPKPPRERQLHWPTEAINHDSPRSPSTSFLPHNEL